MSVNEEHLIELYKGQEKILVAVDCIIFGFDLNEIKLLLFKRKVNPLKGSWSLIGSFVKSDKTLEESAQMVLKEYTGLQNIYLEELKTFSEVDRDPGGRVISTAFFSLIPLDDISSRLVEEFDAAWFGLNEIPDLILDHSEMVEYAIQKLKIKVNLRPIGFELLPEKFTLPQIQNLYESIFQTKLDTRNFRKKLLSLDILTRTEEKDKSTSKKGAYLYKFNKDKYENFIAKGNNFGLQ
jgi:ADP-ribose pyrophosphatase YjhB (NUDIX family)